MLGTLAVLDQVAPGLGGGAVGRLLTLLVPAAAGGLVYLVAALVLRAPELDILRRLVRR
jgi:hypothetical protein